jgi:hypothetical protein
MTDRKQTDRIAIMLTGGFEAITKGREIKQQMRTIGRKLWPKRKRYR